MNYIEAKIEGSNLLFSSGVDIIDATITLGQDDKGTTCELSVADPDNAIASALVKHSLFSGGIIALEESETGIQDILNAVDNTMLSSENSNPVIPDQWELEIVKGCLRYGVTNNNQIAYVLATAWKESSMGQNMVFDGSGQQFEGNKQLGNTSPGDGIRYKPRGLVQVTGRGNYLKVSKLTGIDVISKPDQMVNAKVAIPAAVLGMQKGIFTGAKLSDFFNDTKADFYNARTIINSHESAQVVADKANNVYLSKVAKLKSQANASTIALQPKKTTESTNTSASHNTDVKSDPSEIVKGNKLTISVDQTTFEFYHQGTYTSNQGNTKITGQGVRYIMSRRKRNKTESDISLRELALKVTKAHKLKLDYQALIDPHYSFVDQTAITDYALLKRECEYCGLFLSESKGVITIKSLANISDTNYTATLGYNIISYDIKDIALNTAQEDTGSALMQGQDKVKLNPITGQFEQVRIDIDPVKDISTTGNASAKLTGSLSPGQEAIADQSRARTKRVKGLPSTFVLPLDSNTLDLEPLQTLRTKGISEIFDRVWLIDTVTHAISNGTTTVNCYSPIEVIVPVDNSQPIDITSKTKEPKETTREKNSGGFIWGAKGVFTSPVGARVNPVSGKYRMHAGTDIGAAANTPIAAAKDGICTVNAFNAGGYGWWIELKHSDNIQTRYGHMIRQSTIRPGQTVKQGEVIGYVGSTGGSTGNHLHQEFRRGKEVLRPEQVGLFYQKGAST